MHRLCRAVAAVRQLPARATTLRVGLVCSSSIVLSSACATTRAHCSSKSCGGEDVERQLQRIIGRLDRVLLHLGGQAPEVEEQQRNMLAVAHEQHCSGARVGYLIAGNAGKVAGGLLKYDTSQGSFDIWVGRWKPLPQEEGSLNNFLNADHTTAKAALLSVIPRWGMEELVSTSPRTKQGVDYTMRASSEAELRRQVRYKYHRCLTLGPVTGYSEEFDTPWDTSKPFQCHLYISAGPMARCPDTAFRRPLRPDQSMRRTFDPNATTSQWYLRAAIKEALTASLLAMDEDGVTVAIVPGLSTGVYAPSLEIGRQLRADYLRLVEEAVDGVELRHIQRVIYCNKAAA